MTTEAKELETITNPRCPKCGSAYLNYIYKVLVRDPVMAISIDGTCEFGNLDSDSDVLQHDAVRYSCGNCGKVWEVGEDLFAEIIKAKSYDAEEQEQ